MKKEIDNGKISLKELLMQRICNLEKVTEERFQQSEKALLIQTKEIERRLENLNGEASRLRDIQATYLPRETYEIQQKDTTKKIENLEDYKNNNQGKNTILAVVISIVLTFLLNFLLKK